MPFYELRFRCFIASDAKKYNCLPVQLLFWLHLTLQIEPMKHVYLAALAVSATQLLHAQITITDNDMPSPNDSVRFSYTTNIGNADQHLTGPAYLWDFSFLTADAQERITFETPVAFPFSFTATVGVFNPSPDSIPGIGAIPTDFYDYFKNGSSGYRQVGSSFTFSLQFPIPIIYSSSDYLYRFPLQAGNMDSSDASYGFQVPSLAYIGQERHRVNTCDGWGTLITPFGSFQTLRVKSVVDQVDTISFDSTGGITIPRPQLIEYKWLGQNSLVPLLQIDAQMLFNNEVITGVTYQDSIRDSVFQVSVPEQLSSFYVNVYPNPVTDRALVHYELKTAATVDMEVYNIHGQRVLQPVNNVRKTAGIQAESLDLSALPSGVYLLRVKAGQQVVTHRLVRN